MSVAHLQGRSAASTAARPQKKAQADVMLQRWIARKPLSTRICDSQSNAVNSPPSSHPLTTRPSIECEEKQQLQRSEGEEVDDDALLLSLTADVNFLTSASLGERKRALQRLCGTLRSPTAAAATPHSTASLPPVHPATLTAMVSLLLKPLLRTLTDEVEQCRALSASLLLHLLSAASLPTLLSCIPFLLPTLSYRLQARDLTSATMPYSASNQHLHYPLLPSSSAEPSEDVRLSLFGLAALLVHSVALHSSEPALVIGLPELISLIAQGLVDRSPAIKQTSTSLLSSLLQSHPQALRGSSLALARVLTPNLLHPHHRTRRCTLDALRALIPIGAAEHIRDLAAFRERNVIDLYGFYHGETRVNHLGRLVQDDKVEVRRALYSCVGEWLESMREAGDYETLLMPYLLSGLHDQWEGNRALCMGHLQRIGEQFERDRAEELQDAHVYGAAAEALSRPLLHHLPFFPLTDFPFRCRPSLGLRLRLRPFIDRLLPTLLTELRDWQRRVQRDSMLLLRSLLFLEEETVGAEWLREVVEVGLRKGGGEGWSEVMALAGRYGGDEVMREMRLAREDGRSEAVIEALPHLLCAMPPTLIAQRVEEVEGWMAEDRHAGRLSVAGVLRQVKVYEQLLRISSPAQVEREVQAAVLVGARQLRDAMADRAGKTSECWAALQRVEQMLEPHHQLA